MPAGLAAHVAGCRWHRDLVGESGGTVHRLSRDGTGDLYLKHGTGPVAGAIADEMARLRWLAPHVPVPRVVHFQIDDAGAWLLGTALPGRTAWQWLDGDPEAAPAIVDAIAAFLRRLHAIPAETCPFAADRALRLADAAARMAAGLVDEADFDDARAGWSARQVWDAMQARPIPDAPPVVTHGDFSLDNILIANGIVTGCIDVGRAGRADRYQDLAIAWNGLGGFDPALQRRLFAAYGIPEPDMARIEFHLMLDEFF